LNLSTDYKRFKYKLMKTSLIQKLCCPIDKHDLTIDIFTETDEGEILEALMNCPHCHRHFPVIYGIPILIPDAYRDRSMEGKVLKKWGLNLQGTDDRIQQLESEVGD